MYIRKLCKKDAESVCAQDSALPLAWQERAVRSTPGYGVVAASTLKGSPHYALGALFQSACSMTV